MVDLVSNFDIYINKIMLCSSAILNVFITFPLSFLLEYYNENCLFILLYKVFSVQLYNCDKLIKDN